MSADGQRPVQVTRGSDDERSPAWLGAGKELLLVRNLGPDNKELRVVSRDGEGGWGAPRTILRGNILNVAVAPGGAELAFTSTPGADGSISPWATGRATSGCWS